MKPEQPSSSPEFRRKKTDPLFADQRGLVELRSRLLGHAGNEVLWVGPEPHLEALLQRGSPFPLQGLRRRFMADSECHRNAASLWYESKGLTRIATGYALSTHLGGVWLPHSWGLEGGRIVETTSGRMACYYGVELAGEEALKFMFANASPDLMERFGRDLATGALFPELVETARAVVEGDRLQ
jgi:hypothetical protein